MMPNRHPSPPMPVLIALALITAAPVRLAVADSPTRLKLQCTEQPGVRVVVNAAGSLASEQIPPASAGAVEVHAIKTEPGASGPDIPARLISTLPALATAAADWTPGNAIGTADGRLRLDLTDQTLFLIAPEFGNQALFRRFSCQPSAVDAPVHYQCGPDYDLWIQSPPEAGGAASALSARIRYPGGELELPRVEAGSGQRYQDADSRLALTGDAAIFTLAGGDEHRCQIDD